MVLLALRGAAGWIPGSAASFPLVDLEFGDTSPVPETPKDTLNSGGFQTWQRRGSSVEDTELQESRGRGRDVGECKLSGFYMYFVFLFC